MPRGDRTGPDGMGPLTGHAAGYCAGYDEPGFTDAPVGYGRGYGRGMRGRGFRGRGFAPGYGRGGAWGRRGGFFRGDWPVPAPAWTPEDERSALTEQARGLEAALESIKSRLGKLEDQGE